MFINYSTFVFHRNKGRTCKNLVKPALLAVRELQDGIFKDPNEAWDVAGKIIFPTSPDLQTKGCPKNAFVGLCNNNLVSSVSVIQKNAKQNKNAIYACKAVEPLKQNKYLTTQPELLWEKVAGNTKSSNSQMDVVIALWSANLLRT